MMRHDRPTSILEQSMTVENGMDHSDLERDSPSSRDDYKEDITRRLGLINAELRRKHSENDEKDSMMQIDKRENSSDFNGTSGIKEEFPSPNDVNERSEDRKEEISVRNDIQMDEPLDIKKESSSIEFNINNELKNHIKEELRVRDEFR